MITMAYGKTLLYKGDKIGLDTEVTYKDQNGNESKINMRKFVEKAKKVGGDYFGEWIPVIENNDLSIGVVVIDGLNRIAKALGEEIYEILG